MANNELIRIALVLPAIPNITDMMLLLRVQVVDAGRWQSPWRWSWIVLVFAVGIGQSEID